MFNDIDIINVAKILNIDLKNFSFDDIKKGINIELEHGKINPKTNITNNNLIMTAKIALAHLNEFPNYYNEEYGIISFENFLKNKNN